MKNIFLFISTLILFVLGAVGSVHAYYYYPSSNNYIYYPSRHYTPVSPVYPGCSNPDIVIGGQIWSSCNALNKNLWSPEKSGWFFAKDAKASFISYNVIGAPLEWQGKVTNSQSWMQGPCARGYRLPSRYDWETIMYYARLNGTSVSTLLNLPRNGGFRWYKDSDGDVMIKSEQDILGAYWTSDVEYNGSSYAPIVMRINGSYQNYRMDGTYYSDTSSGYDWQYGETGLSLVAGTYSDLANVRCIKK